MVRANKSANEKVAQVCATFFQPELEEISGFSHQTISRFRTRLSDQDAYESLLRGPSWRKAMGLRGSSDQKGASGTGENEWFTPSEYIELARQVFGGVIDLDPATSAKAQEIIQATTFYTKKNNGLKQEWHGSVWLNPPYAQPLISEFITKLCDERRAGHVIEAISLTHNYTDTSWFHELAALANAICFTRGRVKFYEGTKIAAPTQGQAFAYFGDNVQRFADAFGSVGFIVVPFQNRAKTNADESTDT